MPPLLLLFHRHLYCSCCHRHLHAAVAVATSILLLPSLPPLLLCHCHTIFLLLPVFCSSCYAAKAAGTAAMTVPPPSPLCHKPSPICCNCLLPCELLLAVPPLPHDAAANWSRIAHCKTSPTCCSGFCKQTARWLATAIECCCWCRCQCTMTLCHRYDCLLPWCRCHRP